jgi:hypothetical protein
VFIDISLRSFRRQNQATYQCDLVTVTVGEEARQPMSISIDHEPKAFLNVELPEIDVRWWHTIASLMQR